jgi:hypothetical protein
MRLARSLFTLLALAPIAAAAQSPDRVLTPLETQTACGPPTSLQVPSEPLHVIGSQDPENRFVFGTTELLVLDGGTARGVQLGQQFVVRRPIIQGEDRKNFAAIHTNGWLRVVAVNEKTALARVEHFCDAITAGDYLEPFVAPSLAADLDRNNPAGELDFNALGRIVMGPENMNSGGAGGLMLIEPGGQPLQPGARFAVYRDPHVAGMPLASVGEGVVLSVGPTMALTKITRSRDAIVTGDYVVPRK